ncbi:RNA polymerase sigma factor [Pendulispora albinea]|uniref:Sigma-70 family RNA polymerase sigma factor n=1 Tax=Pendulispora albinea TaxID=2741071 RepID=A0ABZ2LZC8_9BACT
MDRWIGGEKAFGELYAQLTPRLFRYISRRARDSVLAEDLVQQTWMQLYVTRGRFVMGSDVLRWAYWLARRALIDHFRIRSEMVADPNWFDELASPSRDADERLDSERRVRIVDGAVSQLPKTQRIIIALIKEQGASTRTIARMLGISVNAAKLRRHRACQALRAALDEHLRPAA